MGSDEIFKVVLPNHIHAPAEHARLQAFGADRGSDVAFIPSKHLSYFGECHYRLHLVIAFSSLMSQSQRCVTTCFDFIGTQTMQSQELASLANMSSQWLNRLLDRTGIPGVRRKENGRLEIFDEERATEWACNRARPKQRKKRRRPQKDWVHRGRSSGSVEARASLFANAEQLRRMAIRLWSEDIPELAQKFGVSKQALYQAVNRAEKEWPGFKAQLVRGYERDSKVNKRRKLFRLT
jgi:hypothetical protein